MGKKSHEVPKMSVGHILMISNGLLSWERCLLELLEVSTFLQNNIYFLYIKYQIALFTICLNLDE